MSVERREGGRGTERAPVPGAELASRASLPCSSLPGPGRTTRSEPLLQAPLFKMPPRVTSRPP